MSSLRPINCKAAIGSRSASRASSASVRCSPFSAAAIFSSTDIEVCATASAGTSSDDSAINLENVNIIFPQVITNNKVLRQVDCQITALSYHRQESIE